MILPFLLLLAAPGQTTSDRLPPANPVPYVEGGDEASAVLARVQAMLAALGSPDPSAALLAQVRPEGGATVAAELPDGSRRVRHWSWAEFAAQLHPGDRADERISDPAIEVDGDVAMVWAPYTVTVNGAVDHCGYDHFDLVREGGQWKVLNVTWSARHTGCTAPR